MAKKKDKHFQTLKHILEQAHIPNQLDSHPWTESLFVQEVVEEKLHLLDVRSGKRLVMALATLFAEMIPSTPPKQGTRLDNHWGEFGMLAALYFAPVHFGAPPPKTMGDAWGRIDESIFLFVQENSEQALTEKQEARFQLIDEEMEIGPASTMSDWKRRGIERLLDIILSRERFLESELGKTSPILQGIPADGSEDAQAQTLLPDLLEENEEHDSLRVKLSGRLLSLLPILLVLLSAFLIVWGGIKTQNVYFIGMELRQDLSRAKALLGDSPNMETIERVGPLLQKTGDDLQALEEELGPFLGMTNILGWVPVYGGDLESAQTLLELAQHLVASAEESYQAAQPIIAYLEAGGQLYPPSDITELLHEAQPEFSNAYEDFEKALELRDKIDSQKLSPKVRDLLVEQVDPLLPLMEDSFAIALSLPKLLGATEAGPKTYLLLAQNEDELRSTGGFISAVGTLVVQDGKIIDLEFKGSGLLDDIEKPYPMAPWQLRAYMNSRILILRDANWFTHFPTTALWAEYLNAYVSAHSVDGVIAFDQQFLVILLEEIGPLEMEGVSWPITAETVISYLRLARVPPPEGLRLPGDVRKDSISNITKKIFTRLETGSNINPDGLVKVFLQALKERHLLLCFDDPLMAQVLSRNLWDGAIRPGKADFLMVVDTNVGFNKVNARIERNFVYEANLNNLENITSHLSIFHKNISVGDYPCVMGNEARSEVSYPINGCYWNYLRVYTPEGTTVVNATFPPEVPGARMVLNRSVPEPRVDVLDEEIEGVQGFGSLTLVPTSTTVATGFEFALPGEIIKTDPTTGYKIYRLKIQKQPGTIADSVTIRVHLPPRAILQTSSPEAVIEDNHLLFRINLRTDAEIEVVFRAP